MMRKVRSTLWIAVLTAAFITGTAAAGLAVEPSPAEDGIFSASFAANIVTAYPDLNLSVEYIEGLRADDLGWGEIVIAAGIASASGKTLDEVIALADSGLGWGEIAASLGVKPQGLGRAIRGVIGNAGKTRANDDDLDNAAAEELLNNNFDLTEQELEQLAKSGIKKQDVLVALSAAVIANDPTALESMIRLRQENRNWQQVFEIAGVDPKGIRNIKTAMLRSEVRAQLRERLKEFQRIRTGRPESTGPTSGGGPEVADEQEQAGDDHGAGHGHGHTGHGSGGSSGGGGSKSKTGK